MKCKNQGSVPISSWYGVPNHSSAGTEEILDEKFYDHIVDGNIGSWISIESCFLVEITGDIIKISHMVRLYMSLIPFRVCIWLMLSRKMK